MMRSVSSVSWVIAASWVVAACADVPGETTDDAVTESATHQELLTANRLTANRLTANRLTANRLTANRLTANRLTANRLTANMLTAGELLKTEDGRELFGFIVSCALPDDITIEATVAGTTFEFPGELGLAREWMHHPLDDDGQGWVSACLFSRVSAHEVAVPISARGPTRHLRTDADERAGWPVEEGAFYGNFFVPVDQPIQWFACRGAGQAAGEGGGLVDRQCAEPDPAHPGLTLCGFNFAGDCGTFSSEPVCEDFSEHGLFYRRCHTQPLDPHGHGRGDDVLEDVLGFGHGRGHDRTFEQVITTYVTP
jgi:hypothetical protein